MPRLAIAKTFLNDYAKLDKPVREQVDSAISKFADRTYAGLHLEPVNSSRDPRIRTIRVDLFWRGVVLAPESGDTFCLLTVLPHDKAYAFAASHRCTVNQVLGILEVRDEQALERVAPALAKTAEHTDALLFAHVSDPDFKRLGIDAKLLPVVRLLSSEAQLESVQQLFSEPQVTALLGLAAGMTVEETWQEVAQYLPAEAPGQPVDTNDIVAAMRRTPGEVVFVTGHEELRHILADPFAAWRVFLHPAQRKIAFAPRYAGPAQVTGGAGTGKTVTALHRTAFLAQRAAGELFAAQPETAPSILLTTFTTSLADALTAQFRLLADDETILSQVEITNVDRLAYHIVEKAHHARPVPAGAEELTPLWSAALEHVAPGAFAPSFLQREWEQVILAQDLHTEQEYLTCSRAGQGRPLGKTQRSLVWRIAQHAVAGLASQGRATYLQLANEAAHILRQSLRTQYRHVLVDEAQDLHPAQWRLLRAAVPAGPDDMFVVGDPHQRIYDNHVSLASLGINVRGRSRRLTVNYRTTQEILAWSVPMLGTEPVTGLDDEVDVLTGYRSPMHGHRPTVRRFATSQEELAALAGRLRGWLAEGIEPHAIAVAARARYLVEHAQQVLTAEGIPHVALASRGKRGTNAVRLGTMHRMKGLEFQAVAAIGVADGIVPAPRALTPAAEDPVAHALDLQRERCVLFVACTRARDRLYLSYTGAPSPFLP